MEEKVTSKHYAERAIINLESILSTPDGFKRLGGPTAREIVQDIVSAAILAAAEIQKEAMGIIMQDKP